MDDPHAQTLARMELMLQDLQDAVEENGRTLRQIQRAARWSFWGRILIWLIVLILPFLVLGPVIHALIPATYAGGDSGSFLGLPSLDQIQELIRAYQASGTPAGAN